MSLYRGQRPLRQHILVTLLQRRRPGRQLHPLNRKPRRLHNPPRRARNFRPNPIPSNNTNFVHVFRFIYRSYKSYRSYQSQ